MHCYEFIIVILVVVIGLVHCLKLSYISKIDTVSIGHLPHCLLSGRLTETICDNRRTGGTDFEKVVHSKVSI